MALRTRKSIPIAKGVRLNGSRTGVGPSIGARGARHLFHGSVRRPVSAGAPGPGVGYWRIRQPGAGELRAVSPPSISPPKPGLFAPGLEKLFFKAVRSYASGDLTDADRMFKESVAKDELDEALAAALFGGLLSAQANDDVSAIPLLEKVVSSHQSLPDELMETYAPGWKMIIGLTDHATAEVPFGSFAAALVLTECYQRNGRYEEAIGLLQQLVETVADPIPVLSLCELLAETGAWDEIAEAAAGTRNEDDASLEVLIYQARALELQGVDDAALEVYKEALRSEKRHPALLREARYGRGKLYLKLGKEAQGRRDLAQVYADEPGYRDVLEVLEAL
jgi:tetratricopeptide (TPR) repeat protein